MLYECKKKLVAYYIKACVFFTQNIQNEGLTQSLQSYWEKSWLWCWYAVAVANRLFKLHKKSVHMAYLVMRWFCVWLQSSACYYLFTQTHSVKPKPMAQWAQNHFEVAIQFLKKKSFQKEYCRVSIFGMKRK